MLTPASSAALRGDDGDRFLFVLRAGRGNGDGQQRAACDEERATGGHAQ
jgi:hypothetical protein